MKKTNISTQTLLAIFEEEMEVLKRYSKKLLETEKVLDRNFERIQNYKLQLNTDNIEELNNKFEKTANRYLIMPRWFSILAAIIFMIAILEGFILYYLVFPQLL